MPSPYDYVVAIDSHDLSGQPCKCDCGWHGPFEELVEIGACSLTPGDPSPAGRCPECDALAYLTRPMDYARDAGPALLAALNDILEDADDTGADGLHTVRSELIAKGHEATPKIKEPETTALLLTS